MYGAAWALRNIGQAALADRYNSYLQYLAANAQMVFYRGSGNVSWVTQIKDANVMPYEGNYDGASDPGDPYEVCTHEVETACILRIACAEYVYQ